MPEFQIFDALSNDRRHHRFFSILGRRRCRSSHSYWLGSLCLLIAGTFAQGAAAQISEPLLPLPVVPTLPQVPVAPGQLPEIPGQTVMQRPRPDLEPIGLRAGSFFWFPRAELDEQYNNNIFATQNNTVDDAITVLQPGFDLLSNLPRNAINLHAGAVLQHYAVNPSQSTEEGYAGADGRLDVTANSDFHGAAQVAHLAVPRTSPLSPGNAAEPLTYNQVKADVGYTQARLRLGYAADLAVQSVQYNSVPAIGGGTIPESAADVTTAQAALEVNYLFIPDFQGYARGSGTLYRYPNLPPSGINFDSTVYRGDFGLRVLPRHLIYGEIYVGYLSQVFNQSSLGSVNEPDAGGRLVWNVTPLTTLTFRGLRSFETTNPALGGIGAGFLSSRVAANVDHELRHNLLVSAYADYENDKFQGVTRTDNVYSVGTSIKYLLNRNLYLGAEYDYQQRASTLSGSSYARSLVTVRLSTQF